MELTRHIVKVKFFLCKMFKKCATLPSHCACQSFSTCKQKNDYSTASSGGKAEYFLNTLFISFFKVWITSKYKLTYSSKNSWLARRALLHPTWAIYINCATILYYFVGKSTDTYNFKCPIFSSIKYWVVLFFKCMSERGDGMVVNISSVQVRTIGVLQILQCV